MFLQEETEADAPKGGKQKQDKKLTKTRPLTKTEPPYPYIDPKATALFQQYK